MRIALAGALVVVLWTGSAGAQMAISGDWALTLHEQFGPNVMRLSLTTSGDTLTGSAGGRPVEGTFSAGRIAARVRDAALTGALDGAELKGEIVFPDRTVKWTAVRIPPPPPSPKTHVFEPSNFELYFSSKVAPVLRIHPGDTVRTWSVDAGGRDRQSTRRSQGGNPQTGPFYVEGAMPNDTLVVRLNRVRINRDWAQSGRTVVSNALQPSTVAAAGDLDALLTLYEPGLESPVTTRDTFRR